MTVDAVADWCDSVARDVTAGSTLRNALGREPLDPALADATAALRFSLGRGRSTTRSAQHLVDSETQGDHRGDDALRLAGSVIIAVAETGASASLPLRRVAGTLRLRSADRQERDAHSAQARMSAHVLTVLPIVTLLLLVATDPDVRAILTASTGVVLVIAGGTLNVIGWWWMRRIVDRAI